MFQRGVQNLILESTGENVKFFGISATPRLLGNNKESQLAVEDCQIPLAQSQLAAPVNYYSPVMSCVASVLRASSHERQAAATHPSVKPGQFKGNSFLGPLTSVILPL